MDWGQEIIRAHQHIQPHIYTTPYADVLSAQHEWDVNLGFKSEHLQRTGSFKIRGALNKMLALKDVESTTFVTASSGNHGLGVATAAKILGRHVTVYVPDSVSPMKLRTIEMLGATIEIVKGDCLEAEYQARKISLEHGALYIPPYNDQDVICGQGTVGYEIKQQADDIQTVFVAVGGGGLISGIGAYLKSKNPEVKIIGCWAQNSAEMYHCLQAGKIIECESQPTLSDGTAGGIEQGAITFDLCQQYIDDCVLVSEDEIRHAMRKIAFEHCQIVEGAAAMAYAGFLKYASHIKGQNACVVLCGRNIQIEKFKGIL